LERKSPMKKYTIIFKEEVDEKLKILVNDYWEVNEGKFVYPSLESLADKHSLKKTKITELVTSLADYMQWMGACTGCGEPIFEKVKNRGNFKWYGIIREKCTGCELQERKNQAEKRVIEEEQQKQEREQLLSAGIAAKNWLKLTEDELLLLRKIISYPNGKEAYFQTFQLDYGGESVWPTIAKFQRLGLLTVIDLQYRSEFAWDKLLPAVLPSEMASEASSTLKFSLEWNNNRIKVKQPHYSGTFNLKQDVVLKAGIKYLYGGWEQTDGSINLQFKPVDEITVTKQTRTSDEPDFIGIQVEQLYHEIMQKRAKRNRDKKPPF